MLLTIFVALNAVGFAALVLGNVFGHQGIAAMGGVIVVGAGVGVIGTGLEYEAGEERSREYATVDNETVVTDVTVTTTFTEASLPEQYAVGLLVTLVGSLGMFRALDSF